MANRVIGPAGMPDFRPLNPWGRAMPKPKRPVRTKPVIHDLYQLFVTRNEDGRRICVGPRVIKPVVEEFCQAVNLMIASGKEKAWREPSIERVALGNLH